MNGSEINYNKFFGFSGPPFNGELDQKFLFLTNHHKALLADMANFVIARRGAVLLEGDSGVGKTMLAHALVQRIPQNFTPLIISRPVAEPTALMVSIAQAMAINIKEGNLVHLNLLVEALYTAARQGKFYLVLIDDAHKLTDQHLEEVCLLSQMEFHDQHLLPFVLVAQTALSQRLSSRTNQRLALITENNINLTGLTPAETLLYIDHRLHQVGSSFAACFAENCPSQLFVLTGGNPRRINTVCHQVLERCWLNNFPRVTLEMLLGGGKINLQGDQVPPAKSIFRKIIGAMTGVALAASLVAYVIYTGLPGKMYLRDSETPETLTRTLLCPPQDRAPSPSVSPSPQIFQEQAEFEVLGPPAPPKSESPASQEHKTSNEPSGAAALPPPQPDIQSEDSVWSTSINYQVTAKDHSLNKIIAAHYAGNEKFGFAAVILANPQITEENLIYTGQILLLPKIHKGNNIIKLSDNMHYLFYNRYNNEPLFNKNISMINDFQIRFLIRETQHPTAVKVYWIYLGGYEREDDIKEALRMIERK